LRLHSLSDLPAFFHRFPNRTMGSSFSAHATVATPGEVLRDRPHSPPAVVGMAVATAEVVQVAEAVPPPPPTAPSDKNPDLDLLFLMDATGSMGSYIQAAKQNIVQISNRLASAEGYNVRFGLVAYRDHPPQDHTYVTNAFPFTSDVTTMHRNLATLSAQGGGDGPEAVEAGLQAALEQSWRDTAMKVVVLIADAPPHGLGESGDGFPEGAPTGVDPLEVLDAMSSRGICVYAVGCQPALSRYNFATDFMIAAAERTNGQAIALGSAAALADVIMGASVEEMDLQAITSVIEQEVMHWRTAEPELDEGELLSRATQGLQSKGIRTRQMKTSTLTSATASHVSRASTLKEAKASLSSVSVPPATRGSAPCWATRGSPEPLGRSLRAAKSRSMAGSRPRMAKVDDATRTMFDEECRAEVPLPALSACAAPMDEERCSSSAMLDEYATISGEQVSRMFARGKKKGLW